MLHALGYLYLLCVLQSEVRLADRRGTLRPPAPAFHTDSHYSLGTQWIEVDGVHFYANWVKGWENTRAHARFLYCIEEVASRLAAAATP